MSEGLVGFAAIKPHDTIEFVDLSGPESRRRTGRVVMRNRVIDAWVVKSGNESRPSIVDETNFVRIVRSSRNKRQQAGG